MMAKYGARYLTKGESHKMPEGGHWKPLAASCAVDQVAEDEPTIFFAIRTLAYGQPDGLT